MEHTHTHTHTHTQHITHTMEYTSVIKKNKIMSFPAIPVELNIILSDGSRTEKQQTAPDITYAYNLKTDRNELINKTDRHPQIKKECTVTRKQRSESKDKLGRLS